MRGSRRWALLALPALLLSGPIGATQINTFNRLEIGSDDGSFSLRLEGLLQADANFYQSDKKHLPSGGFIRRARIGISGNLHEWGYRIVYDNARIPNPVEDAKIYRAIGRGTLWIGQFKVMEGLEEITKDDSSLLMERSYLNDVVPGHQVGVAYNGASEMFGYAVTGYNRRDTGAEPLNGSGPQAIDVGYGGAVRAYFLPLNKKTLVVHTGGSYAYESSDVAGVSKDVRPLGRTDNYADGGIDYDFKFDIYNRLNEKVVVTRLNFEELLINGPLILQGEYMTGRATTNTKPDDDFYLWYAEAGYLLTGESHLYDSKKGRPEMPRPQRAIGAFEIAARYQKAVRKSVPDAMLMATEYGINYYANENVRFSVNYGTANNKLNHDNPSLWSMRAQFSF